MVYNLLEELLAWWESTLLGAREIQVILVTSVLVSIRVLMPVFSSKVDRIRQTR